MAKRKLKVLNGGVVEPGAPMPMVTAEERERWIAEAAYYLALQRGFQGGNPVDDWLQAEREIDYALLDSSRPKRRPVASEPHRASTPSGRTPRQPGQAR